MAEQLIVAHEMNVTAFNDTIKPREHIRRLAQKTTAQDVLNTLHVFVNDTMAAVGNLTDALLEQHILPQVIGRHL